MKKLINHKVKALTLTELLVVMVIIGILVLLALPNLMPQVTKAKTMEAKMQLKHVQRLQKTFFMEQELLVSESDEGQANYQIVIEEASTSGFRAKATAVVDFDGDGIFDVWEIDEKGKLENTTQD